MSELEQHFVDDLVSPHCSTYRHKFSVRWVLADEVVFVESLELVVANAACHCWNVVDVGLGDHRRHSRVNISRLEFISDMRLPEGGEIVIGHDPILSLLQPQASGNII